MNFIFDVKYRDSIPGSAACDIEIEFPQGILATLYWADKNGTPLEDYLAIKSLPLVGGKGTYALLDGWMIPEDAESMRVRVFNDAMLEIVLPEMTSLIPEGKRLAKAEPISRVFLTSDVHIGGDFFHNRYNRDKAFRAIADSKPDFVLIAGDVANNSEVREYELAAEMLETYFANLPVGICPGNHDYTPYNPGAVCNEKEMHDFYLKVVEHNSKLGAVCTDVLDNNTYAMTVGGVQSLMINANIPHPEYGEENRKWMEEQLTASDGARYRFIVNHYHQRGTVAGFADEKDATYYRDNDAVQEILDRHGKIVHVSGHTHLMYDADCLNTSFDAAHKNLYVNAGCAVFNSCCMGFRREYYLQNRATGQILEIYDGYMIARGIDFVTGKFFPRCLTKADM